MTVSELELRMSSYELTEWQLFEKISGPLGRKRQDIQAATISAAIVNSMRIKGKPAQISDFLISYEKAGITKTPHEMLRTMRGITRSMGGTIKEGV